MVICAVGVLEDEETAAEREGWVEEDWVGCGDGVVVGVDVHCDGVGLGHGGGRCRVFGTPFDSVDRELGRQYGIDWI